MANVCDYSVISDGSFELNGTTVLMNFNKTLEGTPVSGEGALLMWREQNVESSGSVQYEVTVNGNSAGKFSTSSDDSHSMHEVLETGWLRTGDNVISFTRITPGKVHLSDVVLMFRQVA